MSPAIKTPILATLLLIAIHGPASLAQVPAVPAKPGEAVGTVKAGTAVVTLKHAYAQRLPDETPPLYQVILTDQPVAPEALANELKKFGGRPLLRAGKISGVSILVDARGSTRNVIPFIADLRGSNSQGGGSLDKFAESPSGITGQGQKAPGEAWSYSASFNAALAKP